MSLNIGVLDRITDLVLKYDTERKAAKKAELKASGTVQPQGLYSLYLADAFTWLAAREENSIHAIVTDPPYGLKEYTDVEKAKLRNGHGGVWRIPPSFDGHKRSPLPRFTVLGETDI